MAGTLLPLSARDWTLDLSPAAQIKWGLKYIRERYGSPAASWHAWGTRHEEDTMGESNTIRVTAPMNPYRAREALRGADELMGGYGTTMSAPPPRSDTERGPGLTADDLNRIAVDHHRRGYAMAEREGDAKVEAMLAKQGDVFDEGYAAGRVQRAQGLAGDFRSRLLDLHFRLAAIEKGPKAKAHDALPAVRGMLNEIMDFADAVHSSSRSALHTVVPREVGGDA